MTIGLLIGRPRATLVTVWLAGVSLALAAPMTSRASWVGYLPTTSSAIEATVVWLPSLLGGVAAWLSGQYRAHGLEDWVSSAPRHRVARRRHVVGIMAVTAASILTIAWAMIVVDSSRQGLLSVLDSPWLLMSAPTALAVTMTWIAVGSWLGSDWPRAAALSTAVLAPYVVSVVFIVAGDSPVAALAVADGRNFSYVRPDPAMWSARTVFWSALAVAVVLRVTKGSTRLGVTAAWAASASAAVALFFGASFEPAPGATDPFCAGSDPRLCLDDSFRSVMPRYAAAVETIWPEVPEALRPSTVSSAPFPELGGIDGPVLMVAPVHGVDEPARVIDGEMFAARFGDALFASNCSATIPRSTVVVVVWWRSLHGWTDGEAYVGDWLPTAVGSHAAVRDDAADLDALGEPERDTWFRANVDDLLACREVRLPR